MTETTVANLSLVYKYLFCLSLSCEQKEELECTENECKKNKLK